MARKVKFGSRFKSRPKKSAGNRRQRVKTQRNRLITAGWDKEEVRKLDVKALRDAIKTV